MPEINILNEGIARLLDVGYRLGSEGIDTDFSADIYKLVKAALEQETDETLVIKVNTWLCNNGNCCIRGKYGSAERERGYVIEALELIIKEVGYERSEAEW